MCATDILVATVPILLCRLQWLEKNGSWRDTHLHKPLSAKDGFRQQLRMDNKTVGRNVSIFHKSHNNTNTNHLSDHFYSVAQQHIFTLVLLQIIG